MSMISEGTSVVGLPGYHYRNCWFDEGTKGSFSIEGSAATRCVSAGNAAVRYPMTVKPLV